MYSQTRPVRSFYDYFALANGKKIQDGTYLSQLVKARQIQMTLITFRSEARKP